MLEEQHLDEEPAPAIGKAIGETHNDFTWAAKQLADIVARAIRGAVGKTSPVTST